MSHLFGFYPLMRGCLVLKTCEKEKAKRDPATSEKQRHYFVCSLWVWDFCLFACQRSVRVKYGVFYEGYDAIYQTKRAGWWWWMMCVGFLTKGWLIGTTMSV